MGRDYVEQDKIRTVVMYDSHALFIIVGAIDFKRGAARFQHSFDQFDGVNNYVRLRMRKLSRNPVKSM